MTEEEKNAILLARQLMGTKTLLTKHGINLRPQNAEKILNQTGLIARHHKTHALKR